MATPHPRRRSRSSPVMMWPARGVVVVVAAAAGWRASALQPHAPPYSRPAADRRASVLTLRHSAPAQPPAVPSEESASPGVAAPVSVPTVEAVPESSSARLRIPVSGAATKAAFQRAARAIAQERPIPGWRKKDFAKIPAGVVARQVGPEMVTIKALELLSETEVHAAISSLGVKAVGQARFDETPSALAATFAPGEPFEMVVSIDVWPEAPIWGTPWDAPFEVEVARSEGDQRVRKQAMDALRERYATAVDPEQLEEESSSKKKYAARLGDLATIDVVGYERKENGEKGDKLDLKVGGENLPLVLEAGKFLPGVVEAIVGASKGDVVDVPVTFPAQLPREPSLAGKTCIFQVSVKNVQLRVVPDEQQLAASLNTTLEALERQIDDTVTAAQQQQQQKQQGGGVSADAAGGGASEAVNDKIEAILADRCAETPLPDAMVAEAARQKFAVMLADMRSQGTPDEDIQKMISKDGFEKYKKIAAPAVSRELRTRLAVRYIANLKDIQVSDDEVDEQLQVVRAQYEGQQLDEAKAKERITDELTRLKVCDYLRDNVATVKVKTVSPEEEVK